MLLKADLNDTDRNAYLRTLFLPVSGKPDFIFISVTHPFQKTHPKEWDSNSPRKVLLLTKFQEPNCIWLAQTPPKAWNCLLSVMPVFNVVTSDEAGPVKLLGQHARYSVVLC
jgi:hypothetical protein